MIPKKSFGPVLSAVLTLAMILALPLSVTAGTAEAAGPETAVKEESVEDRIAGFADVDPQSWYYSGIQWAIGKGVMNGMSADAFEPFTVTSRAMIMTMLWRMEGSPKAGGTVFFKDVQDGQWYTEAIRWAAAGGLVSGYNEETFGTADPVTREQLATILYRFVRAKGRGFAGEWAFTLNFEDADQISEYAYEPLCWMTKNGIVQGMDKTILSPKGECARAQAAVMLMRLDAQLSVLTYDEFKALTEEEQIAYFNSLTGAEIYSLVKNSDENWPVTAYDLISPDNAKETIVLYNNNGALHFNLAWPCYGGFLPESIASVSELSGTIDVSRDGGDGGYIMSFGRDDDGSYPNDSRRSVPKSSANVRTGILDVDQYKKVVDVVTNGESGETRLAMLMEMGYSEEMSNRFLRDQTAWLTRDEIAGPDNINDGVESVGHTVDSRYGYYGVTAPWAAGDLDLEGGAGQMALVFSWGTLCDSGLISGLGTAQIH